VEEVLKAHGAWEAHNYLRGLKADAAKARAEAARANEPPVARVIGKAPLSEGALPNWADGARRAPAQAPQKDVCRIIPQQPKKPEMRVINVEAPDEAELRRRQIAAQNKF
jgi:hypothetical protein